MIYIPEIYPDNCFPDENNDIKSNSPGELFLENYERVDIVEESKNKKPKSLDELFLDKVKKCVRIANLTCLNNEVTTAKQPGHGINPFIGMFADEPELIDDVLESAMKARETQPFRANDE